jgi:hypothetical protein
MRTGNNMGSFDPDQIERVEMLKISTFDPTWILGETMYYTSLFLNQLSDIPWVVDKITDLPQNTDFSKNYDYASGTEGYSCLSLSHN